ncbi:hypothetical protein [Sphingobium yanoikuyae]|uniref:Uncharacterized protein n=1 Tax=Sphingobium yanoikuyae TaxID=13690 RepID=A0A291MZV3_SPHYA|nr:hypothetical protein [Sphingobium yanoikuyae]ATI80541.1 hypothetical protein A6768_11410 [Sphingobium yanoikuyae]
MRIMRFDSVTYFATKDSGAPVYRMVEEELPEIEMITDADGNPTLGGRIGYYLAYVLMATFVGYIFYVL